MKHTLSLFNPAITHNVFRGWRYFFDTYFDFTYYTHDAVDDFGVRKLLPYKKLIRIFRNFIVFYDTEKIDMQKAEVVMAGDIFTNTLCYTKRQGIDVFYSEFFLLKKSWIKVLLFYILGYLFFRNRKFIVPTPLARETFCKISSHVYYLPILYHGAILPEESLHKEKNTIRFLYAGRMSQRYKNIDFLIENYIKVHQTLGGCSLTLVGPIHDSKYLGTEDSRGTLSKYNIHYLGEKDSKDLNKIYTQNDVLLLISDSDPIGAVTLEAMAHGLATIVSDTVGSCGYITDNESGLIIGTNNPDDLQSALQKIIQDPILLDKLRKGAIRAIRENHSTSNSLLIKNIYTSFADFLLLKYE